MVPKIPNISKIEPLGLLAAGSILQFTLTQIFPSPLSIIPTLAAVIFYWSWDALRQKPPPPLMKQPQVRPGRWTAQFPNEDGSMPEKAAQTGVVMFVLGVTSSQYIFPLHDSISDVMCKSYDD